jgi:CDP-diacylglycerol--glycerol-3-phosphate 3-phosphatidyltransferase
VRITANQVTFARLLAIPFLAALLYGGPAARTVAMILGIVVGATDFVDGYLARKYGPTVLGGLMDPIADKVFVVTALLPIVHTGWAPWWLAYAILLREFLVTALRSSFEQRDLQLRSTYLAKVKTWVQMLALALAVAAHVVPRDGMVGFFIVLPALALSVALVWLARGRVWRGAWIFFGCFAVAGAFYIGFDTDTFLTAIYVGAAVITWVSAVDYVVMALRQLRDTHVADVVRIAGATLVPILAVLDLQVLSVPAWAIIATVAIEVAHGGLDNLLAHHEATAPAWAWAGRTLGTAALLGAGLLWPRFADVFAVGALTVTLAGTTAEFWRNRAYYLEDRPKKKRKSVATPAVVR